MNGSPSSARSPREKTNRHLAAAAEKVRMAGRLLEEAAELVKPGTPAHGALYYQDTDACANAVNTLWGMMASGVGEEYLESFKGMETSQAAIKLGEICGIAMMLDKAAVAKLLEQPDFCYRAEVEIVLQLRALIDGERSHA